MMNTIYRQLTPEEYQERKVKYLEIIEPILHMKMSIYSITLPTITVFPDGRVEHKYNFTPEQHAALNSADEAIQEIYSQLFRPF